LLEAVAAVHGLVTTRLERHAGFLATVAARCGEHLAGAAAVSTTTTATTTAATSAACRTVSGATARGVLKATARVELLLSGGPDELLATVATGQGLVCERHSGLLSYLPLRFEDRGESLREDDLHATYYVPGPCPPAALHLVESI
jgi:hypothetical protein